MVRRVVSRSMVGRVMRRVVVMRRRHGDGSVVDY